MDTDKSNLEDQLFNDGLELLSNGHRITYVFKYVRDRAGSDEARQRVMERITTYDGVKELNEERFDTLTQTKKISNSELIIGLSIIGLAGVLTIALWNAGWVSSLPLLICFYVILNWQRSRRR